jgi:putative transposase
LRRVNTAFAGFFRRVKARQKPGYPRFKGKAGFDSVEWPKDGDGARRLSDQRRVYLQGVGQVKVHLHRQVQGRVKTIQVMRQGRCWMLVWSCDDVPVKPLLATGRRAGVDVAVVTYATLSDGAEVANARWARQEADRLAAAQQRLQQAKRGSNNRTARRETVAARHRKIANRGKDFHHKQARDLVTRYDLLVVDDLTIANMVRRARPKPDPGNPQRFLLNGARAKSGLNRSISDASWGQFVSILRAKAEDAGRTWIEVDPRHTSDRCECCGHAAPENRLSQAAFACQRCGHRAPADEQGLSDIRCKWHFSDFSFGQRSSATGMRSANVIARALSAGFQRMAHLVCPVPLGSSERVTR